jgi:hypothetical protein
MRVRVIFARAIVLDKALVGACGAELLEPELVVVMKPALIIIDEHRRGDVHRVDEAKTFAHGALTNEFFDLRRDVDEARGGPALQTRDVR